MDEPSKIDPLVLVGRREIELSYVRLDGATGRIFRNGDRAIIRVSDQIVQLGRRRFTIAHEIAHFMLGHRLPTEEVVDAHSRAPFSVHQEREANAFATEFLMPKAWVKAYCTGDSTSLDIVHAIAKAFQVSNVAAAVRLVELSDAPRAVAYSERGCVEWASASRSFPGRIPPQLKIGARSVAAEHHLQGVLDLATRVVPSTTWLGTRSPSTTNSFVEHSELVPEPGWGGVLSMLGVSAEADDSR